MAAANRRTDPIDPLISRVVESVIQPSRFYIAPNFNLRWTHGVERIHWEVFRGRVLDRTQTRQTQTFYSWSLNGPDDDEPWLSIKWHPPSRSIHVTRSIRCRSYDAYDEGGVIRTRPVVRRIRELVGSVSLDIVGEDAELREELATLLTQAVTGTHRLPITSLETPMPEYSLGFFSYSPVDTGTSSAASDPVEWITRIGRLAGNVGEAARVLEFAIRCTTPNEMNRLVRQIGSCGELNDVLRMMFRQVSLTPYVDFTEKVWFITDELVRSGQMTHERQIDFFCWVLRLIARHLTSFDLVEFHHRGANYPDALMMEELSGRVADTICAWPPLYLDAPDDDEATRSRKRLRRRAVRQSWLIQRENAGRLVPKEPTTPGESARVLPFRSDDCERFAEGPRVNELRPIFRAPGRLDPASSSAIEAVLRASIRDLTNKNERRELGLGLFLDRPLGVFKQAGEPDRTLLFVYECYSGKLAAQRQKALEQIASCSQFSMDQVGILWRCDEPRRRPGVVSLQDIQLSPHEFRIVRTTQSTLNEFWAHHDLHDDFAHDAIERIRAECTLVMSSPEQADELVFMDESYRCRLRAKIENHGGYRIRRGREYLLGELRIVEARSEDGELLEELIGRSLRSTFPVAAIQND